MKTKLITSIMIMLFLASIVMFTTTSVKASPYTALDYDTAIIKVANWILRHQAVDGAFDAECSWGDCSYGTGYTDVYDYNVLGRIGNTLLDAYDLTGDAYYLDGDATHPGVGAKKTADLLKILHWATELPVGCHWWTPAVKGRWRSDDYLFMLRYAAIRGDASYSTKAYDEWVSFKTECNNFRGCSAPIDPDDWINNMFNIYGYHDSWVMYEVAPYIYAACVLGDTTWANEVAVACTTARDGHIDLVDGLTADSVDPGLAGALLFALQKLDPSAYAADITVLTDWLKDTQNSDGSWGVSYSIGPDLCGFNQNTAWAIKGLGAVGEWAAIDGADYLVANQITDLGIYKTGGYWETTAPPCSAPFFALWVDAEAAQGLACMHELQFDPTASTPIMPITGSATLKVRLMAAVSASLVPDQGETVRFSSNPTGLTFSPTTATTDVDGYATVTATGIAGLYTVTATVFGVVSDTWTLVVYDPKGMAAGGGWYNAYDEVTETSGTATFGFVAKYIKGSATGNLEFQYHVENKLNLKSTSITWLVVSGSTAQFRGQGTVNGAPGYYFFVVAKDNGEPGTSDWFKIKIWNGDPDVAGTLIHDSGTEHLDGGNIIVRTK